MTNFRPAFLLVALLASSASGSGCGSGSHAQVGSETNWLRRCEANKDCTGAGACVCGVCSERCDRDDDCSAGLSCQSVDSALVGNACGPDAKSGLCAPDCDRDSDCAGEQHCVRGACTPEAVATGNSEDAGVATPQGRTPQAYVLSALLPDSSCVYASDNATVAGGVLDIARNGDGNGDACTHGYRLRLRIASDEPGVLQLSGATVKLMNTDQKALTFHPSDGTTLPNPFTYLSSTTLLPAAGETTAAGIFEVEVVRASYAPFLSSFEDDQILVEVRLQALDADDAPVTFRPFVFPIAICDGCLTMCTSGLEPPNPIREDIVGDHCDDNSGSDGRICFDPGC